MIEVGSRVKVPFGSRTLLGYVTALLPSTDHPNPKPILKVLGSRSLITPKVLELARWIASYYCCPIELALKTVLPVSVRREKADWQRRLVVHWVPYEGDLPKLTARQKEVYHIIEEHRTLPLQRLLELAGCKADLVRRLEAKGLVRIQSQIQERDPFAHEKVVPTTPLELNPDQQKAKEAICKAIDTVEPGPLDSPGPVFLLHGVTGSGKTEVYLQVIAYALEQGKGAIVLVPEISLTPQTIERFRARFCHGPHPTEIAVLHSHLSHGERHDQWHRIRAGYARIVIGPRSAVFAPVENLGLIIVDEEHEPSYKQTEAPRYHARDVAIVRARQEGAVVVLGSATPSIESYYNAQRGKFQLLSLPKRIDNRKMPHVKVVDMRLEYRAEQRTIFSQILREAIQRRLEQQEQIILFLNRRGYAPYVQCPRCGQVVQCPHCSVSLTYHRTKDLLCCHFCGYTQPPPKRCPNPECRSPTILYAGIGTQRVELILQRMFPKARIQRMDSDVLQRKEEYRHILNRFRSGQIDILIGTQMIAKGLHFPRVTLVGIINADLGLHRPDFRAAERTFQLLTQVSGRAGRGDVEGEVIIQSFVPSHPAIQFARRHDYAAFYQEEIEFRHQLGYPPFRRIALLTLEGFGEEKVRYVLGEMRKFLEERIRGISDLSFSGPAPAPLARLRDRYRYQLILRTRKMTALTSQLAPLVKKFNLPKDLRLIVDVDPTEMV